MAAIGPATAGALQERACRPISSQMNTWPKPSLPGIGDVRGQHILLPRADIARKALAEELARQGAQPDDIAVYHTLPAPIDPQAVTTGSKGVDIATFTSSSTLRNFLELLGEQAADL